MPPIAKQTAFRVGSVPKPLQAAINDARRRAVVSSAQVRALTDRARIYAFSVACDLSNRSIQTILRAAMGNIQAGQPFNVFKRSLTPEIINNITAPEVVYRNAAQNAYQRGRFNQQARLVQFRPFLMYVTFRDDRVRPNHAIMEGVVSPQGSSFWAINYPPNGHNCRCIARALSRRQVGDRTVYKTQAEVERVKYFQQIKAGVPKSKTVRPIADVKFRSSLHANEAAAEVFVNAFKTFNRSKWSSIFTPHKQTAAELKSIAADKPVTKPNIKKFKPAKTIDDAKAYTEALIANGNKSGYLMDPKTGLPYRHFYHSRTGPMSNKQQIELYFGNVMYTDDISLETLNRLNKHLFELAKRADDLKIPRLRGLILKKGRGPGGSMGDGVLELDVDVYERRLNMPSAWKKGDSPIYRGSYSNNYFDGDAYGASLVEHEFAHHIHQSVDGVIVRRGVGTPAEKKLAGKKSAWRRKQNKIEDTDKREYSPTAYATKNAKEWFAENYALWKKGRKELIDTPLKPLFKNLDAGKGFEF